MMNDINTAGRPVAVITGASSGIGAALARKAAAMGCKTVLVARRRARLEALAAELEKIFGVPTEIVELDLTASGAVKSLLEYLEAHGIAVDILVNCAGFGIAGPMMEMDLERVEEMLRLNNSVLVELTLRIGRDMKARGKGQILNVASSAAFQPCPFLGAYGATKAFVLSFSEALAEELRHTGVTVTALCPGPTATEFGEVAGLAAENPMQGVDLAKFERTAAQVAATGWRAMERGQCVVIDGGMNACAAELVRFLPRELVRRIAGRILGRLRLRR